MPSRSRRETVRLGEVGVYHCWSRCVRRAFLCGEDHFSGIDYEYRRFWVCEYEQKLAGLFAIDVAFHAELSNHLHLVLRIRPDVAATWSDEEVARRWLNITHLVKSKDGELREISEGQIRLVMADPVRVQELRQRLANPSMFMGALCEHVARRGNREDGCSGSFWEDRYKCRELTDEGAILVCGIYVDLNQIRAGEALTPETSTHTSAYDRILGRQQRVEADSEMYPDDWLCELALGEGPDSEIRDGETTATSRRASDKGLLPLTLDDYLKLLDASGRILRSEKAGSIPENLAPILKRLGINGDLWSQLLVHFDDWFGHIVGASHKVMSRAAAAGRRWYRGQSRCSEAFG